MNARSSRISLLVFIGRLIFPRILLLALVHDTLYISIPDMEPSILKGVVLHLRILWGTHHREVKVLEELHLRMIK
jgi:hypothetical protein